MRSIRSFLKHPLFANRQSLGSIQSRHTAEIDLPKEFSISDPGKRKRLNFPREETVQKFYTKIKSIISRLINLSIKRACSTWDIPFLVMITRITSSLTQRLRNFCHSGHYFING
jgi:hypothetical protein